MAQTMAGFFYTKNTKLLSPKKIAEKSETNV